MYISIVSLGRMLTAYGEKRIKDSLQEGREREGGVTASSIVILGNCGMQSYIVCIGGCRKQRDGPGTAQHRFSSFTVLSNQIISRRADWTYIVEEEEGKNLHSEA